MVTLIIGGSLETMRSVCINLADMSRELTKSSQDIHSLRNHDNDHHDLLTGLDGLRIEIEVVGEPESKIDPYQDSGDVNSWFERMFL
jgi:hypothetical protein